MTATYHLQNARELTDELVEAIRLAFRDRSFTITIQGAEEDTTNFLLNNPLQKASLERSLQQLREGNLITIPYDQL